MDDDFTHSIGQGHRAEMDPKQALEIARKSEPQMYGGLDPTDTLGIARDTMVKVSLSDYAEVPVIGELVATTVLSVSIRRNDRSKYRPRSEVSEFCDNQWWRMRSDIGLPFLTCWNSRAIHSKLHHRLDAAQ
jgi:hypothetical protein